MASWTNQSTSSLLPGEPWTSAKALAAFENPEAIAEGASGAPKIRTAALQPPTAGSTVIRTLKGISAAYVSPSNSGSAGISEGSIGVLVGGTIRVVSTIALGGTVTTWQVQYLKNGVAFATFSGGSTGLQFSDVVVALGDRIDIGATVNGGGSSGSVSLTGIKIESGTADFAVS
jgi:hypothetical protein